jgi:hypothetical protein
MNRLRAAFAGLAVICATAACAPESDNSFDTAPPAAPASVAAADPAEWAGKWVGPEGLFVEIAPAAGGTFTLTMQSDLETTGTYVGTATEGGIAFERGGQALLLRPATGDETGLKYLFGKQDCLMIASGEGFCRD